MSSELTNIQSIQPIIHVYNGRIMSIPIDEDESHKVYMSRAGFVIRKITYGMKYEEACRQSRIWRNIKHYGMKYPAAIHEQFKDDNIDNNNIE